jgi:uncharacterized membrane protein (DUF4010 family)
MEQLSIIGWDVDLLRQLQGLLIALGIGLLLGLEREQAYQERSGKALFAGIRTFPIVALLGFLSAFLGETFTLWVFIGVLLGVFGLIAVVWSRADGKGTTTEFTLLAVFLLGGAVELGHYQLSIGIALSIAALLAFKLPLHNLADTLTKKELLSILQFLLIAALVLPLLPDQNIGPYDFFNLYKTGFILTIFLTLNFGGYFLSRFLKRRSTLLTGLLGGLASSTATAWYFARRSRTQKEGGRQAAAAIVLASSIMFPRVLVWLALLNWALFRALLLPMLVFGAVGFVASLFLFRGTSKEGNLGSPERGNPINFREAAMFALIYTVIQFGVSYASEQLGDTGLFWAAGLSGFANMDAITVSMSEYASGGNSLQVAGVAIVLATLTNTLVKYGFCLVFGNGRLRQQSSIGFALILLVEGGYIWWQI